MRRTAKYKERVIEEKPTGATLEYIPTYSPDEKITENLFTIYGIEDMELIFYYSRKLFEQKNKKFDKFLIKVEKKVIIMK